MRIIAGEARGRRLLAPRDKSIRPLLDQIRESIFSSLGDVFVDGNVLDLFSGIGSFGLEALSRGARRAVFVDNSSSSLTLLKQNLQNLGFEPRATVIQGDALQAPNLSPRLTETFAVVFLDPPFRMFAQRAETRKVFDCIERLLSASCLEPGGIVLLRHPSKANAECPLEPEASKVHGESTVLRFRASS